MTFLSNPFLLMALIAGVASAVPSGIVGTYVVVKRIIFIAGSIAHSVLGGMGLFLFLNRVYGLSYLSPLKGAFCAAILSALLIGWIHLKYQEREDTVIAAVWALGMASGVILISLTPGYNVELLNFLFGNLLWADWADIGWLLLSSSAIIAMVKIFYYPFLAICFDEDQALLRKLPVKTLYFSLLLLIAITTVLLIHIVGAILIIAILTFPPAIANTFSSRLPKMMCYSVLLGALFSVIGIMCSYVLNWPVGATIALTSTFFYIINLLRQSKKI